MGIYDQSLTEFTNTRAGECTGRGSGSGDIAMISILQGFKEVDSDFMQSDMSVRDLFNANMSLYTADGDHDRDNSFESTTSSCDGEADGNIYTTAELGFPMGVGREVQRLASDERTGPRS